MQIEIITFLRSPHSWVWICACVMDFLTLWHSLVIFIMHILGIVASCTCICFFYLHIWSFTVFWFSFCLPGRHICMDFIRISGLFYTTHCFNRYKGTILKEQFKFYPLSLSLIVWWWWITSLSSSKDLGPNTTKGVRENWHHHPIQICRGHF